MKAKYFTVIILLLTSLLTMNFRCSKEYIEPKPFDNTFEVPVNIYPLKKNYSFNDTIWLETDLNAKLLFDTKSQQLLQADTGKITFGGVYNEFGTYVTNPSNGFCDIFTFNGINTNRELSPWGTSGSIQDYGCGQGSYKCKIGFKPLIKGTYWLNLNKDLFFESCSNKVIPYYATISFKFKNLDLGLDVFNTLTKNDKGGKDGIKFYTDKINNREIFVFRVE